MPKTYTANVGGKDYELGKLTRGERAEITDRLIAERRAQIEGNLTRANVPEKERLEALDAFDYAANGFALFVRYATSDRGMVDILKRCAVKVHNGQGDAIADEIEAELDDEPLQDLIGALCHIKWKKPEGGQPAPNPSAPDSSGATAG